MEKVLSRREVQLDSLLARAAAYLGARDFVFVRIGVGLRLVKSEVVADTILRIIDRERDRLIGIYRQLRLVELHGCHHLDFWTGAG